MKVLVINDHKFGGGTESVVALQYQLLKDSVKIDVLYGIDVCPKVNVFSYIYSYKNEHLVYKKVIEGNYDVVHLQNYYHIFSPSILKALQKAKKANVKLKVIYTAHDYHLVCPNSGYYYFKNNKLVNFKINDNWKTMIFKTVDIRSIVHDMLKKLQWINAYIIHDYKAVIDIITTPSNFLKNVILAHYNLDVRVIRNPMSLNDIKISSNNISHNSNNVLKIVFFGRLSIEKGLKEFIDMLRHIHDIEYHFSIIGEGPKSDELKQYVKDYNLNDKIVFKGKMDRSKLLQSLPEYDLFVLPSIWYENAPMSILEAAQANLLIATHKMGGMYEMVEEVGGGFYFEPSNVTSLRKCLKEVIAHKETIKNYYNKQQFNDFLPQTFKNNFMNLYIEALAN